MQKYMYLIVSNSTIRPRGLNYDNKVNKLSNADEMPAKQ